MMELIQPCHNDLFFLFFWITSSYHRSGILARNFPILLKIDKIMQNNYNDTVLSITS